ncbi:hypothetical protein MKX01_030857 [Papaver californicum]|nr:hypothetical protein MKX01_030857 [Papaver californicum]
MQPCYICCKWSFPCCTSNISSWCCTCRQPLVAALGQAFVPVLPGLPGSILPVTVVAVLPLDSVGVPSEFLILKNMFDPTSETKSDFDLDIKDDVQDEDSKFGTIKHIFVDKNSAWHVYLRFETTTAAMSAHKACSSWEVWFAAKMITAAYMLPLNYEVKFPDRKCCQKNAR